LAGALFLCVAFAVVLLVREFASWRESAGRELAQLARDVQRETQSYFSRYEELFLALAETECVRRRDGPECSALFARLQRHFPHAANIAAVEADGRFFASAKPFGPAGPPNVGELPFFRALAAGAPRYVMDLHTGPITGEEVIGIVVPLRPPPEGDAAEAPGAFGGLIGATIRLAELSAAWAAVRVPEGLAVAVADRRGRILYASQDSALAPGTILSHVPGLDSLALGRAGEARARVGERDYAVRAVPVDAAEWLVLALGPPADSLGAYLRRTPLVWQLGAPIALLALLGGLLSWREVRAYRALAASEADLRRHHGELEAEVAQRQAAEEEARRVAADYQDLYDNAPCGFHSLGADGVFLRVNDTELRWLGYEREELVGKRRIQEILTPESRKAFEESLPRFREEGEVHDLELEFVRQDGTLLPVVVNASAVRDPQGAFLIRRSTVFDDTARRRAQEALRRANADLEAFAYTASHDLRAPLRAMSGFAQALLEDFGDRLGEDGRDHARRVVDAAGRMDALVQDLLQYSRLSRADLSAVPVDLEKAVQAAVAEAAPLGQRGLVSVEGPLPGVLAHEAALRQAVANLVANALKFVPPDREPRVRVRAEERDGRVRLWVEDNGIGIAPEHRERIFRVFERLHRAEEYPGTGIGLAIVERAIVRMGGAVGVESEPGRGSRFWVELPGAGGRG
jgi:PAS domain S-box-containing protein